MLLILKNGDRIKIKEKHGADLEWCSEHFVHTKTYSCKKTLTMKKLLGGGGLYSVYWFYAWPMETDNGQNMLTKTCHFYKINITFPNVGFWHDILIYMFPQYSRLPLVALAHCAVWQRPSAPAYSWRVCACVMARNARTTLAAAAADGSPFPWRGRHPRDQQPLEPSSHGHT